MGFLRRILGKWFSVNQERSQGLLVWFMFGFLCVFVISIILARSDYKADPNNPFNIPTVIGIFLSLVAFYWSVAIALAQKEISAKLEKQNKEIEGVMAAVQKYCVDLHAAMSYIYEDFIDSLENIKETKDVSISLYISSLALGCISSPSDDDHHALYYFNKMLEKIIEFGTLRSASDKAFTTQLHIYVWEKEKHFETFSIEGGTRYGSVIEANKARILEAIGLLKRIFITYKTKKNARSGNGIGLFLHSTKADTVRFFHVQRIISDKLVTVESSMILMMPSIAGGARDSDEAGSPDLICMALWDGTEKGRERMGNFFEHYKKSCCHTDECEDGAKAKAIDFAENFDERVQEYFGTQLMRN